MEYTIVNSRPYGDAPSSIKYLNEAINEKLSEGFKLHGSGYAIATAYDTIFYQPMIKE